MRFTVAIKQNIFYLPLVMYSIIIFMLSSNELPVTIDLGFSWQDKVFHFLAFALYGILAQLSLYKQYKHHRQWICISALISILYAASDEIHQFFVPGRFCDFYDFLADVGGILCVHAAGYLLLRALQNKRRA